MSMQLTKNLLVIDVETTGSNPARHDILAVGMVPFERPERGRVVYVRPPHPQWNSYARANFQRFASVWEAHAIPPSAAVSSIEGFLTQEFHGENVTPIGHNIGFDVGFLRKLAFLAGKDELFGLSHRALDTHTMLYLLFMQGKLPASALSSDGAFAHFGIRIPDHARHTALGDARATRELVIRLLDMLNVSDLSLTHDALEACA